MCCRHQREGYQNCQKDSRRRAPWTTVVIAFGNLLPVSEAAPDEIAGHTHRQNHAPIDQQRKCLEGHGCSFGRTLTRLVKSPGTGIPYRGSIRVSAGNEETLIYRPYPLNSSDRVTNSQT